MLKIFDSFKNYQVRFIVKPRHTLLLLCSVVLVTACGLRGPLTLNAPPVKGLPAVTGSDVAKLQLKLPQTPASSNLLANPNTPVLSGANGQRVIVPSPTAQ